MTSGTVAALGAALLLLVAACGEQSPEETNQGAAPTIQESTVALASQTAQDERK